MVQIPPQPIRAVAVQPDGKIVVAGSRLLRYDRNGSVDASFGASGVAAGPGAVARAVAIQSDGMIVAGGPDGVVRYRADGSLDPTFGAAGIVALPAHDLALQTDGKLVVAGGDAVYRCNADGSPDPTFGFGLNGMAWMPTGRHWAFRVAIQGDGRIVVAGSRSPEAIVVQFHPNGKFDERFGSGGVVTGPGHTADVAVQRDGRIVVVGRSVEARGFGLLRYDSEGRFDEAFGAGGGVNDPIASDRDASAAAVALQADGRIVVVGPLSGRQSSDQSYVLARYHVDGQVDASFGTNGHVFGSYNGVEAYTVAIQGDGKILAAGFADSHGELARYWP